MFVTPGVYTYAAGGDARISSRRRARERICYNCKPVATATADHLLSGPWFTTCTIVDAINGPPGGGRTCVKVHVHIGNR